MTVRGLDQAAPGGPDNRLNRMGDAEPVTYVPQPTADRAGTHPDVACHRVQWQPLGREPQNGQFLIAKKTGLAVAVLMANVSGVDILCDIGPAWLGSGVR